MIKLFLGQVILDINGSYLLPTAHYDELKLARIFLQPGKKNIKDSRKKTTL